MSTVTTSTHNNDKIESKSNIDNQHSSLNTVSGNEIITLCIGHCGSFVGQQFVSTIMSEQSIDKDGTFSGSLNTTDDKISKSKTNVYFDEIDNKYIPRSIFVDFDAKSMNQIRCGYLEKLLPTKNLMSFAYAVPSTIWPRGHYTDGAEFIDEVVETIRNTVEICDNPQGFNFLHAISGGVGGGFGSILLIKLRDNYSDKHTFTFSVYSGIRCNAYDMYSEHNSVFGTYNTMLAFNYLVENANLCFSIDNAKLWQICANKLKLDNPTYDDLNWILSLVLSGITSTLRFQSEPNMNTTLKRMNEYFTPFPRLHFVSVSHSPFFTKLGNHKYYETTDEILCDALSDSNSLIHSASRYGYESHKIINMCCVYRGTSDNRINVHGMMFNCEDFVAWLPPTVGSTLIYDNNCYEKYTPLMATIISNTTKIKTILTTMSAQFARLFKRKINLYLYKAEGMDECEFQEAERNMRDLCEMYKEQENVVVDLDNTDNDDDEDF